MTMAFLFRSLATGAPFHAPPPSLHIDNAALLAFNRPRFGRPITHRSIAVDSTGV
jgi:hypothetical protein